MRVGGGAAGAGRGPAFYDGSGSAVWAPAAPASRAVTQQATAWPARRRFSAIEIQYNDMIRPRRFQNQNNLFLNKTAECGRARRWRGGWRWSRACPSSSRPSRRPPTARRARTAVFTVNNNFIILLEYVVPDACALRNAVCGAGAGVRARARVYCVLCVLARVSRASRARRQPIECKRAMMQACAI